MIHSPEELLKKLNKLYEEPELLAIVNQGDSPSEIEAVAEKNEYPLSLVREARYAGILKRDHVAAYENAFKKSKTLSAREISSLVNKARLSTKQFACNWGSQERSNEFPQSGIMAVTPHQFLPPLFWDYELRNEEEVLVFSSKTAIPEHQRTNIRCLFTEGSRSIPVGMLLICEKHGDKFRFRRVIEDDTVFWWDRVNPVGARLNHCQGEFFSAGTEEKRHCNVDQQISLRTLGDKEAELLERFDTKYDPKHINYHLILEEQAWYSSSEKKYLWFNLEMRYKLPCDWKTIEDQYASLVTFYLPFHNSPYEGPNYNILTSVFQAEHAPWHTEEVDFTERVEKMLHGTPEQIRLTPTLENFFSFKREPFFYLYNEGEGDFEAPLVPLRKKKAQNK